MDKQHALERLAILRALLFVRLVFVGPFLLLVADPQCTPLAATGVTLLLLAAAGLPIALYFLRRSLLEHPRAPAALAVGDFAAVTLVHLIASNGGGTPVLFPLYFVVAIEAACWWGWPGALVSGAASGLVLSWLFAGAEFSWPNLKLAMIALNLGWPVVLGYFTQWVLHQWRDRRHMAACMAGHEDVVRQVRGHIQSWYKLWQELQKSPTPQNLLEKVLQQAQAGTASPLGLVVYREVPNGKLQPRCWVGMALTSPEQVTLRCGDLVTTPAGGTIQVQHVLEVPFGGATPGQEPADMGRIIVARTADEPYREDKECWLQILAGAAATLLENRFLRGQLGRLRDETDSVVLAGWTFAALPNPEAAIELACRNILDALALHQVVIFLYGQQEQQDYHVIICTAGEPVRTVTVSLAGRGLQMLRRFLDSGTSLIINRRGEWPELFDRMGWEDAQAVAAFPLVVLERRWGLICLLARIPDAFPPHTQQSLAIFSSEVALALENHYLRRAAAKVGS